MRKYLHRLIDSQIEQALQEHPAVMITGPRACGKTTTAARHAATLVRLDRPAEARVFQADPDAALKAQKAPILLDEWQEVPEVLGAVKRVLFSPVCNLFKKWILSNKVLTNKKHFGLAKPASILKL